jgi:hypothetical protein
MSRRSVAFLGPIVACALASCVAAPGVDGPGVVRRGLQGTADPGDPNVVDIVQLNASGFSECSGSLIAPNLVLTAEHCVAPILNTGANGGVDCATTSFGPPAAVKNLFVSTKPMLTQNMADFHAVNEIVVAPAAGTSKICGVDQALIILADQVMTSEAAPLVPRVDVAATDGEAYTAIGFGLTSDTATDAGTRRRLDGLAVACVGADCGALFQGRISFEHELVGDHGTCEGDSGGPALDHLNRVFGVLSRAGAACMSPVYGDVYTWADWIKQTAQHAADVGAYQAPSWVTGWPTDPAYSDPVGGACNDPVACPSSLCLSDDVGSYCTRLCNDASPCDAGYTCQMVTGGAVCTRIPKPKPGGCSLAVRSTAPAPATATLLLVIAALLLLARRHHA